MIVTGSENVVPENEEAELTVSATDLAGLDLEKATIEVSEAPLYGTVKDLALVDIEEGTVQWSVTYSSDTEIGLKDSVQFTVSHPDLSNSFSAYATVEVTDVADDPVIDEIEDLIINEDEVSLVDFTVSDPDSEVSLEVSTSENEVSVTIEEGKIKVIPNSNYSGTANITLVATDNVDDPVSVTEEFIVEVAPVNDRPLAEGIEDQVVDEDGTIEIQLSASDVEQDDEIITFNVSSDAENDVEFFQNEDVLTIVPNENFNGEVSLTVVANDQTGSSTEESEEPIRICVLVMKVI